MLRCRTFPGISKWNHAYVTQFNHDDDDIKLSLLFFTLHATQYTQKLLQQKKKSLKLWQFAGQESRSLAEKHHFGMLRVKNSSHQNQKKLPGFALF